jgi:signal transduction histidine kinase
MSKSSAAGPTSAPPTPVPGSSSPVSPATTPPGFERWDRRLVDWCPYVTLAISAVLSLAWSNDPAGERLVTAGLVALAALWVFFGYTRAPRPRQANRTRMIVYFIGLLVIASALALREYLFFIFLITGFFHATMLRPWALVIVGVFATSVLVNSVIGGLPNTTEWWTIWVAIIVIQTLAIGGGALLGERLAEQSEQRRQTVAKLETALEENAGLHAQLLTLAREAGVLDERQRMAAEIHDTIAQGLTGVVTQLEAAEQASDRPEDWQRHVRNAIGLARDSLSEARRSVEGSRPGRLETARLPDALAEVAREWSELNGVPVEVTTTGDVQPLHPEVEVALLRTAQEALVNVAKHANASHAWLTLSYMGDVVTLDVRDDGIGFAVPAKTDDVQGDVRDGGFGLTAMRQRVNRVAGTLAIESEPGAGTAVSARVPAIVAPGLVGRS